MRVQELPGLLKRYKDGVPGWELKAVDLDSTIAGRDVVPRDELLAAVKERSPVYTHREVVLGGRPQQEEVVRYQVRGPDEDGFGLAPRPAGRAPVYQPSPSPLGSGVSHGEANFERYGQGGENYGELIVLSPEARQAGWGENVHHFHQDYPGMGSRAMSPEVRRGLANEGVAHARFDTHGDALRINELQSDLGIHNRKTRESLAKVMAGGPVEYPPLELPFPMEDAWADLLIKRLALEAARQGHRAIEVASPRAIADKVGGNIDNYEHFYGKVVPGALERLGRKMGGLTDVTPAVPDGTRSIGERLMGENARALRDMDEAIDATDYGIGLPVVADIGRGLSALEDMHYRPAVGTGAPGSRVRYAADLPANMEALASMVGPENMNEWVLRARESVAAQRRSEQAIANAWRIEEMLRRPPPTRRYIMSDEMRKRILTEGIPAAIALGIGTDQVLDRLNEQSPSSQLR